MPAAATRSQNASSTTRLSSRNRASRISHTFSSVAKSGGASVASRRASRGINGSHSGAGDMSGAGCRSATGASHNGELRQRRTIDLDAEPGPVRDLDPAGFLYDRLADHRHADRMLGLVEFEQRFDRVEAWRVVRQGGNQLQRRGERDAGAPDMRVDPDAERVGHVGDLLGLGGATGWRDVGLEYVDKRTGDQRAEAPAGELRRAAGNG